MVLSLATLTGTRYSLEVDQDGSLALLKKLICDEFHIPEKDQRLVMQGGNNMLYGAWNG